MKKSVNYVSRIKCILCARKNKKCNVKYFCVISFHKNFLKNLLEIDFFIMVYLIFMIKGIGTDIIEVSKIKNIYEKWGDRVLRKVFTDNEINYCNSIKNKFHSLSARFAAKEAVLKAIGIGLNSGFRWKDIEIVKEKSGKPEVKFKGKIKILARKLKLNNIEISVSHSDDFAVAVAIIGR